ncbi:hypothetical protein G3I39_25215 [Streptomyces fulvissimus]|uniref:Uncharacterized protein n=1 Tax=Streptomyces microflavus TaxID=1919 RepID=A0A6N9VBU0_STRMI|nr:DUF6085 family protein [Streptomyces microflavus]NEB70330.1 hypothetical protein [Streptomyces microflavus]NEE45835.1 hypothetical protein [Streptomyces sp. SID8455]
MNDVQGRCPACGSTSLFLGSGGYVTCARLECPEPDAASSLLERPEVASQAPRRSRRDDWMGVVRLLGGLAAVSWLIVIVATIAWAGGDSEAVEGVVAFSMAGALLMWGAFSIWRGERG